MSRRVSARKRRSREDFPLREQLKIEEGVFENRTMMFIGKLFTRKVVSRMRFIIGKGKEADVYLAEPGDKVKHGKVALKIFRLETSSFSNRMDYMVGDPRFNGIRNSITEIVGAWCKKEFGNLKIAKEAGVSAPAPYSFAGNVLAIEFLGEGDEPARALKDVGTGNPDATLDSILDDIRSLYRNNLVHSDISEYNILMKGDMPYLIDFGQAVAATHPKAGDFLRRDVTNILGYFSKVYGIDRDLEVEIARIVQRIG